MSISALAIAEFAASMDENSPAGMVAALLKAHAGNDHILLTGKAIDRGINYRFEVEEGVEIKALNLAICG